MHSRGHILQLSETAFALHSVQQITQEA